MTPLMGADQAAAELKRRQLGNSALSLAPDPIAAPKPPAVPRPKVEPFARRVAAPELPPEIAGMVERINGRPPRREPSSLDADQAAAELKRRQRLRFLDRFSGRMTINTGGDVVDGKGPRLDDLAATIELADYPRWAPLMARDPDSLGAVEWWLRQVGREMGPQFRGGLDVDRLGQTAFREMMGGTLSLEERSILAAGLSTPLAETVPGAAANLLGSTLLTLGEGARTALAMAPVGAAVGFAATGGPGAPAGAASAAGFGFMAGAARHSYQTLAGLAWHEFGEFVYETGRRLDPDVRRGAAVLSGILGASLETFGVGYLLSKYPGLSTLGQGGSRELVERLLTRPGFRDALRKAVGGWAGGVAIETGVEVSQELIEALSGELAKSLDGGDFERLSGEELLEHLGQVAWHTARGMTLIALPGPGASLAVDLRRAAKGERQARAYRALGDLARSSTARTEAPGEFQGWVAAVREKVGGPVDSILVDGEAFRTFFQEQGADPDVVAAELGVADQLRSYADSGGTLSIPLEVWAAKVAGTPAHVGLADHVRLTPDAMTPAEARQYQADIEDLAEAAAESGAGERGEASPAARILDDVARQLEAAGRPADVARQEAAVFAAFFATMGERSGVDPWQLYQRQALEVRRVLPEGLQGLDDTELDSILGRQPEGPADVPAEAPLLAQGLEALEAGDLDRLASIVEAMGRAGEAVPGAFERLSRPAADGPSPGGTAPPGATDRAYLPDGSAVDVAFEVVELAELVASNTADLQPNPAFPAALQPRDRTRAASGEQVARMAGGLVPELLGSSANVADGAPIVGPDGVVESGNGRVLALGRAYGQAMHSAVRYRRWLEGQGYDVAGMAAPVLIRRRTTPMDDGQRQAFARSANVRTTASMSAAEQARADAAALTPDLLAMVRSNDIEAAANRPFASRFLGSIASGSELGQLVDGSGRLSLDGRRRIRGALLARAYGDIALVERLLEEDEGGLGPLGRALLDAAPEWARLDDATTTEAVLEAVRAVVRQRDSKNPLHFALQQSDAFGGALSVDGRGFLAAFLNIDPKTGRSRLLSRVRLRKLLEAVVEEAGKHEDGGASLLGETARPSVAQMVAAVDRRARRELVETLAELGLDPATATAADIAAATARTGPEPDRAGPEPDGQADGPTLFQRDRWDKGTGDLFARSRRAVELSPAERAAFRKLARREPLSDAETQALIVQGLVEPDGQTFTAEGNRLFQVFDGATATPERREPVRPAPLGVPQLGVDEVQRTADGQTTGDLSRAEAARLQVQLAELEAKSRPGKRQQEDMRRLRRSIATLAEAAAEADRADAERQAAADRATAGRTYQQQQRGDDRTGDLFDRAGSTDSAAFRRWFGGSKVVDGEGRPLVVYHGTGRDFEAFDMSRAGSAADSGFLGVGAYFSNLPRVADAYATTTRYEGAPAVLPVYLALKNPFLWGPKTGGARDLVYFNEALPAAIHDEVVRRAGFEFDPDKSVDPTFDERRISEVITEVLKERGHDGVIAEIEGAPAEFVAFDAGQIKSVHNRGTFDPADPRLLYQNGEASGPGDPRGAITFNPDGRTLLRLFQGANLSTVLHEAGHLFLEVYGQLDANPGTPSHIRGDYQKILDWLGVLDRQDITREHHEKFARGFEAYLMEGRAPSIELQRPFARFRAWLVLIYRTLRGLDVELSDDVRRVFDRMLATDNAIRAAETAGHFAPLFPGSGDRVGMTPGERRAYLEQAERATLEATRQLERDAMDALERERSDAWAAAVERHGQDVALELDARPAFRALAFFGGGLLDGKDAPPMLQGLKLSRDVIRAEFGDDAVAALDGKRQQHGRLLKKDGVHPDDVAQILGFTSGAELVAAMVSAPDRALVIKAEAERRARAELGDTFLEPQTLAEAAQAAVHNDERAVFLMTELKALTSKAGAVAMPLQVIKAAAARAVGAETVRQVQSPDRHLYTSQKWAKEAQRHVAKGDLRAAAEAKRRQLFHFEAWKIARRNAKSVETTLKRWDLISRGRVKNLPGEHRDQILGFLEQLDFRKASKAEVERRRGLAEWVEAQREKGLEVEVDPALLARAQQRHYSTLSVEEFMAYRDTIGHLEHLGRIDGRLLAAGRAMALEEAAAEIIASIEAHHDTALPGGPKDFSESRWQDLRDGLGDLAISLEKMEFILERLDGGKHGAAWRWLFKPFADAEAQKQQTNARLIKDLRAIWKRYSFTERRRLHTRKIHVPELGGTFTKSSLLALALNWGNDSNRQAVMRGDGWTKQQVEGALFRHLDRRDWQTVQAIWDTLESLWPDIEAMQKDLTGSAPPKIQATPIRTPDGETYRGGYLPLKYDSSRDFETFQREEKIRVQELFGGNAFKAATRKGHTIARKGSGGKPVRLSISTVERHLAEVTHDLAYRRAVIDFNNLIARADLQQAIEGAGGKAVLKAMTPWVKDVAAPNTAPMTAGERIAAHLRGGVTISAMGLKATTGAAQLSGYTQTLGLLGHKWAARGLARFYGKPHKMAETWRFVQDKSPMMRFRQKTWDRDIYAAMKGLDASNPMAQLEQAYFWHIGFLDQLVSMPSWLGAYEKALAEKPADEAGAIAYADSIVRMTQSSGAVADLARVQRGPEAMRHFTMFYSYFSVTWNQFARAGRLFDPRQGASYKRAALAVFYTWFVQALLGEMLAGRGPDDDDDAATWAATMIAAFPAAALPFVRDVGGAIASGYGFQVSPTQSVPEHAIRFAYQTIAGQAGERAWWRAGVHGVAGPVLRIPTGQAWITGEFFWDWAANDLEPDNLGEALRHGLLQRRPADQR